MSFLKSLFDRKTQNDDKLTVTAEFQPKTNQSEETPLKKVKSSIQDLVMLSVAEQYKVGEKKYPDYFRSRFGIGFPNEKFHELENDGYIRASTAKESLPYLKVTELKTIASQFDLKVSGKKDELCARILDNVSEDDLSMKIPNRYWIITAKGKNLLEDNNYIAYFMEKHPYDLESIGLDIDSYSKLFTGKPKGGVRDIIWGEFNRLSINYYNEGMSRGDFNDYCNLLRTMALFLEEEDHHKDALSTYMRYIHYRANFYAALSAINYYSLTKEIDVAADTLFFNAEVFPFIANEIQTISNGCDFDSKQLQNFMENSFSKEEDTGVFSPTELAEFVMCGLNGDQDGQKKICKIVMKSSVKKMRN